jgi:rod shape-determining protein MreC
MPVVTEDGIVGCVSEVGLTWCKVSTLLETARSVGVYLPRNNVGGILSGDHSMRGDGLCKLTFVDVDAKNADVQPGDAVYSSGIGSVYPADMKVGEVVSVEIDNASRTLVASVRPTVDFSQPDYMMIITGYQK